VLSGCGNKALREKIRDGARVPAVDIPTLNALLNIENYAIAAYASAIPLLGASAQLIGKQFLSHELAHAVELTDLVKQAGGKPGKPAASYSLGNPRNERQALALLQTAERTQLHAYLAIIPGLSSGRIRAVVATIFANDAQHLAVLRQQLDQPLPGAFAVD
jgi:Ferritin-like domain